MNESKPVNDLKEDEAASLTVAAGFGCAACVLGLACFSGAAIAWKSWRSSVRPPGGPDPNLAFPIVLVMCVGIATSLGMVAYGIRLAIAAIGKKAADAQLASGTPNDSLLFDPTIDGP